MVSRSATAAQATCLVSTTSGVFDPIDAPEDGLQDPGEGSFDASSHDGLRAALRSVQRAGWDGSGGRAIVAALQRRAGSWAFLVDRRCGRPPGATDPQDVIAIAWLTLEKFASKTAEAQRPWAYLWTAVGNELTRWAIADSRLTDPARVRRTSSGPARVARVGLEAPILDRSVRAWGIDDGESSPDQATPSPAVRELAHRLAAESRQVDFWLDAIGRALDVMADARRSYEEVMLRHDPYMREILGLTLDELSALGALMIGPRKGDRAAQSLLLALRHDLTTPTDTVLGAAARVGLLRSHRNGSARQSAA